MTILVAGVGIIVYAATAPAGTQYTVTFDAGTGGFSFTNKDGSAVATISDGTTTYPNLFQIEGAMPGDSYVWTITVAVKNAGTNTVKMYATVGDHNADYTKLLSTASAIHPTLTAAFDLDTTPPNTLNSLINKLNLSGKTTSAVNLGAGLVLAEKIRGIAADKGCFAGSQKSGYQVCFYQVRILSIL